MAESIIDKVTRLGIKKERLEYLLRQTDEKCYVCICENRKVDADFYAPEPIRSKAKKATGTPPREDIPADIISIDEIRARIQKALTEVNDELNAINAKFND